jgi:hypothetical protein
MDRNCRFVSGPTPKLTAKCSAVLYMTFSYTLTVACSATTSLATSLFPCCAAHLPLTEDWPRITPYSCAEIPSRVRVRTGLPHHTAVQMDQRRVARPPRSQRGGKKNILNNLFSGLNKFSIIEHLEKWKFWFKSVHQVWVMYFNSILSVP